MLLAIPKSMCVKAVFLMCGLVLLGGCVNGYVKLEPAPSPPVWLPPGPFARYKSCMEFEQQDVGVMREGDIEYIVWRGEFRKLSSYVIGHAIFNKIVVVITLPTEEGCPLRVQALISDFTSSVCWLNGSCAVMRPSKHGIEVFSDVRVSVAEYWRSRVEGGWYPNTDEEKERGGRAHIPCKNVTMTIFIPEPTKNQPERDGREILGRMGLELVQGELRVIELQGSRWDRARQ